MCRVNITTHFVSLTVLLAVASTANARTIYVDADATGANDGSPLVGSAFEWSLNRQCLGDLNCDGVVTISDLTILNDNWLKSCFSNSGWCESADIYYDGVVNFVDYSLLVKNYGACSVKNSKDMSQYSNKEVFLVSNTDWRRVFCLVPVTTWTAGNSWCMRGIGVPNNACVCTYPTLIYHEEEQIDTQTINEEVLNIHAYYNGPIDTIEITLEEKELKEGETQDFLITFTNITDTVQNFSVYVYGVDIIDLSSDEMIVRSYTDFYSLIDIRGWNFQLQPGETKQYHMNITLTRMPGGGFDADSILYFIQQYGAEKVTLVGDMPQALLDNLSSDKAHIEASDYLSYWDYFEEVVYVEDDYELALLASVYASLINAPLIIKNYNDGIDLSGKHIVSVGNVTSDHEETYTLEQLQRKYLEQTRTDKLIVINPTLDVYFENPKLTLFGETVYELFGKTSLVSPILASAKHELVLSVKSNDSNNVDTLLKNRISELDLEPEYLTIMASPLEIQQTIKFMKSDGEHTWSIDSTRYGNLDNDPFGFAEMKTGRIYGFSTSDVSAYVARVLFFDRLPVSDNYLFIGQGVGGSGSDLEAKLLATVFGNAGFNSTYKTYSDPAQPVDWENKILIYNLAHGSPTGSTINSEEIPLLKNSIILTESCSTCAFDRLIPGNYDKLFCLQLLRNGALSVVASVDSAGYNWASLRLNGILSKDLGATFKNKQNHDHARNRWYHEAVKRDYDYTCLQSDIQFLLGDPTLKYPFDDVILPDIKYEISYSENEIFIDLVIPSQNLQEGELIYSFIEGTTRFVQAKYGEFFVKVGPIEPDKYSVQSEDVNPLFYGGICVVSTQEEDDGNYMYFLIEKDLSSNPLNEVVDNNIAIRLNRNAPEFTLSNLEKHNDIISFEVSNSGRTNASFIKYVVDIKYYQENTQSWCGYEYGVIDSLSVDETVLIEHEISADANQCYDLSLEADIEIKVDPHNEIPKLNWHTPSIRIAK